MTSISGIYFYVDKETSEIVYIGQSCNIERRIKQHKVNNNQVIDRALSENPMRYYVRWYAYPPDKLNEMEEYFIFIYNPKFNFTAGGGVPQYKHSKYTLWDTSKVKFVNNKNHKRNKPFRSYHNNIYIPCGYFIDFYTPELISNIIWEDIENEIIKK